MSPLSAGKLRSLVTSPLSLFHVIFGYDVNLDEQSLWGDMFRVMLGNYKWFEEIMYVNNSSTVYSFKGRMLMSNSDG